MPARLNVLGVGVHAVDLRRAVSLALEAVRTPGLGGYVTLTGVHGVMASQDELELKRIHNRAFLCLPDGIPMVWLGRAQGHAQMGQVAGADFMRALLCTDARHFLWGGGEGVVERIEGKNIVGRGSPPFRPLRGDEEDALVSAITRARPHFVWVGLSTPKQERFMAGFLERHGERLRGEHGLLFVGAGAAFDFLAGTAREAPRFLRGSGFEWLYRMLREPRRLSGRYLRNNPRFALALLQQWARPQRFSLE